LTARPTVSDGAQQVNAHINDLTRASEVKRDANLAASGRAAPNFAARGLAAADGARVHAAAVDADGIFPAEAFAQIRRQRLLGVLVPRALDGDGATIGDVVDICYTLGQACASTALIFAMHQVKMACLVRHSGGNTAIEKILRRAATEQLLLASSTTEGAGGGDIRSSDASIIPAGNEFTLDREASVISYGMEADGIVTTARRSVDAAASDQVLLVLLKANYTLERSQSWDTLGMRGTRSEGFKLRARAPMDHLLADRYEKIHAQTMVPFSHLTWGAVWMGVAAAATAKAQAFIRYSMRKSAGQAPPGTPHFISALTSLRTLKDVLASSLHSYQSIMDDDKTVASLEFQTLINMTKVQASELAEATVRSALRACGLSGYRNDTEFSLGRHLRDVLSAPLMINNDRILASLVAPSLMTPLPTSISD
jgi:acyl-CoA dehydrogenase